MNRENKRILLVEDNPADARLMVELLTNASMGISLYPFDGIDPETLLKHADQAMYCAKQTRNRYVFYGDCLVDVSGEEHGR